MKYILIAFLAFSFFSSFKPIKVENIAIPQLIQSDSCRISKIYKGGKLHAVYHYDSMKNITRIDYYRKIYRFKEMVLSDYSEFEYDDMGNLIVFSCHSSNNGSGNFYMWRYEELKYFENLFKEKWYYKVDKRVRMAENKPSYIDEYFYNSKNQLVKIQAQAVKKRRRKKSKLKKWVELKNDDNNNPIEMSFYTSDKNGIPILNKIKKRTYDSSLNINYGIKNCITFPSGINNVISEKNSYKTLEENNWIWKDSIIKYDCQYNDQGYLINQKYESDSEIYSFEYEYICD